MSNADPSNLAKPAGLSLVVSTWHIARVNDLNPEGLPTDLLSKNAGVFLIFDKILCDYSGLRGELKWCGEWLSADIYSWLMDAGLIGSIDTNDYLPPDFWDVLADQGVLEQARILMDQGLAAIRQDPDQAQLDPRLVQLNQDIFLSIDVENSLPYGYQQYHFQPASTAKKKIQRIASITTREQKARAREMNNLARTLAKVFSGLHLLPPVERDANKLMLDNIRMERPDLCQVIYGGLSHENFRDRRLQRSFRDNDRMIDSIERRLRARENFENLKKVRSNTEDVREQLQRFIVDISTGKLNVDDVWSEIVTQIRGFHTAYLEFFGHRSLLAKASSNPLLTMAVTLLELYLSFRNLYPSVSPVSLGVGSVQLNRYTQDLLDKRSIDQFLRQVYPLGALDAELIAAFGQGLTPPGH